MNVYLPNLRLPSAYQEVEYIQSSGTQYINTGFIPNNNTKVELSMGGWNNYGRYPTLFGGLNQWSTSASTGRGIFILYDTSSIGYSYMFGGAYTNTNNFSFANGNNHTIEISQGGVYQDGTLLYTPSTVTFTSPVNMYIFTSINSNSDTSQTSAYKLYYFKIYDNGTLVRDFVPCYRKSDSVIGLYDIVNNQFYTNAGTGTFSKGNDVTMVVLKNAYIGEVIHPTLPPDDNVQGSTIYYTPIAKTGHTIKQITIQGKGKFNNYSGNTTNTCGFFPKISSAANRTYETGLAINLKLNSTTNDNWYGYRSNNTNVKDYTFSDSWFNNQLYGINEFTIVATKTGWSVNINGNTYSKNYGTTMASVVSSIFNSSTAQAAVNTNGGGTFIELTYAIEYEN